MIFDTYGNLIWESRDIDNEGKPTGHWDGTFNGVPLPQDVFVWKVRALFKDNSVWPGKEYQDERIPKRTGSVTLIR